MIVDVLAWSLVTIVPGTVLAMFVHEKEQELKEREKVSHPKKQELYHPEDKLLDTVLTALNDAKKKNRHDVYLTIPSEYADVSKVTLLKTVLEMDSCEIEWIKPRNNDVMMKIHINEVPL